MCRKSGYFCVDLFLRIVVKGESKDLFLCFLFLRIHSNTSNKSITICVYYVQLFLNINVSYAYICPNILLKNTHDEKLFPLLCTCSMQRFTYYVQTKSNLGRAIFAMIIVYLNNVLVVSCLSPKPSGLNLY